MFVGKTAVTDDEKDKKGYKEKGLSYYTDAADHLYNENYSAYWSYVKEICNRLNLEWEQIAFSNLIKCNNGQTIDSITDEMKKYCCMENQFIIKEIDIVNPKYIIFMVGRSYIGLIKEMLQKRYFSIYVENEDISVPVGDKKMPFCDIIITDIDDMEEKNMH